VDALYSAGESSGRSSGSRRSSFGTRMHGVSMHGVSFTGSHAEGSCVPQNMRKDDAFMDFDLDIELVGDVRVVVHDHDTLPPSGALMYTHTHTHTHTHAHTRTHTHMLWVMFASLCSDMTHDSCQNKKQAHHDS
jgi:hypothetical protein